MSKSKNSDMVENRIQNTALSQLNWQNKLSGKPELGIIEYPLFCDAQITGDFVSGLEPYSFLNTVPITDGTNAVVAPFVLRIAVYLEEHKPNFSKTDESLYHGGTLVDEIAALTSVALGVRIRAGGETRRFELGKDPYGRPSAWHDIPRPTVQIKRNRPILPSVLGEHSMSKLEVLNLVPKIDTKRYISLIRACRLYQDALWIVESDPNLAWLMLVSALETAANDFMASDNDLTEQLKLSLPRLASLLEKFGGNSLVEAVADEIAHTLKATKKFIDFTMHFLPNEPTERPETDWLRLDWSKLKKILSVVYEYRSRALHTGLPFPAPMLHSPFYLHPSKIPSEVPLMGLAAHSLGGTWMPKDVPINLHFFHYITRGVLLRWWQEELATTESIQQTTNPRLEYPVMTSLGIAESDCDAATNEWVSTSKIRVLP